MGRKTAKAPKPSTARPRRPRARGRSIELRVAVRVRPHAVWTALTTGPGLRRWCVREATIDAREGGRYRFVWGDAVMVGRVLRIEPRRRIDLTWHHGTSVTMTLARRHGGRETVLTLRHEGVTARASDVELYAQLRQSWTLYLLNLKTVLERGLDQRERDRRRTFARGWVNCWD